MAIDPLALVLSNQIYVLLTLPDPPPIGVLRARVHEMLARLTPAQRLRVLGMARAWTAAIQQELRPAASERSRI